MSRAGTRSSTMPPDEGLWGGGVRCGAAVRRVALGYHPRQLSAALLASFCARCGRPNTTGSFR